MGFELNKLMRQYGLATPTMLSYEGERGPDVEVVDEETGEVTTTPGEITFDPAKQRAFDQYQAQYQSRLRNAPMYAGSQFQTRTTPQPMSYMQMYQQYLGRDPTDQERTDAIALDANITQENPLSLAQRQQFLRRYEDEFKDLGIRNTGNQAVMDTIGNYYGNILRNPDYRATPIDRSLPFEERNPNVPNPNPRYTGPVISVDDAYANAVNVVSEPYESSDVIQGYLTANQDVAAHAERTALAMGLTPGTTEYTRVIENTARTHFNEFGKDNPARLVEGFPETGRALMLDISQNLAPPPTYETSQTFLDFADQQDQILANLANPLPDESINTLEDARNVDPFAPSSTGGPAYGAYLAKNLDVLDNITGFRSGTPQPGYAALNIPEGGFAPGTPENAAVQQYLANAAKEHFENFGFQEGRQFYKTGGPVKGYQLGGQDGQPIYSDDELMTTGLDMKITDAINQPQVPVSVTPTSSSLYNQLIEMQMKQLEGAPERQKQRAAKIAELEANQRQAIEGYDAMVDRMASAVGKGMSDSEIYFNLASAFLQPTRTGSFGESLGLAAGELGKAGAAKRKGTQAKDKLLLDKAAAQLNRINTLLTEEKALNLQEAEKLQSTRQNLIKTMADRLKDEERMNFEKLQASRTQSFNNQELALKKRKLDIEEAKVQAAKEKKTKELNAGEQKLKVETIQKIRAYEGENGLISKLERAIELSKIAEADTVVNDIIRYGWNRVLGQKLTKKQAAFLELYNLVNREAVKNLKATFGGQLSNRETSLFLSLQGVAEQGDVPTRTRILEDVLADARKAKEDAIQLKEDIDNRVFSKVTDTD